VYSYLVWKKKRDYPLPCEEVKKSPKSLRTEGKKGRESSLLLSLSGRGKGETSRLCKEEKRGGGRGISFNVGGPLKRKKGKHDASQKERGHTRLRKEGAVSIFASAESGGRNSYTFSRREGGGLTPPSPFSKKDPTSFFTTN